MSETDAELLKTITSLLENGGKREEENLGETKDLDTKNYMERLAKVERAVNAGVGV